MHVMQSSPAVAGTAVRQSSSIPSSTVRPAFLWVVRASGLAQCAGGPGVAVASIIDPDGRARTLVRSKEGTAALALDLLAVIDGIEAALLDAALTIAPQDRWRVEVRTPCARLTAMIEGRDTSAAAAASQGLLDRLVDLLTDIADMGGDIAILTAPPEAPQGIARAELDRHLLRRAAQVVRPFPTDRAAGGRIARPGDPDQRAGAQRRTAPARCAAIIELRSAI
ncbi:MAG: hypothetical protein ACJA1L_002663 [Paracoccaceae bacterium]|jgi:hypothetical protein